MKTAVKYLLAMAIAVPVWLGYELAVRTLMFFEGRRMNGHRKRKTSWPIAGTVIFLLEIVLDLVYPPWADRLKQWWCQQRPATI